ncbi:hypothetical protein I3760_08G019100 [Carya illinoinensis]|nr:hypothetical protein I3760_08G019100 [Carya illinoinensis]
MTFFRHHLHEELKTDYLTVKYLFTLWNDLREIYERGGPKSKHTKSDNNRYTTYHQKWFNSEKSKGSYNKFSKKDENGCYRCGMIEHWSHIYRTVKHLVDLYQVFIKEKTKNFETNFAESADALVSIDGEDITHIDTSDFFENPSGRVDHLIGDGSVPF